MLFRRAKLRAGDFLPAAAWSLALACDLVIASETARFAQVFRNIGLVPDGGAVWFLTQYVATLRAKELVFSGRRIDAQEALSLGLVTRVVPDIERVEKQAFGIDDPYRLQHAGVVRNVRIDQHQGSEQQRRGGSRIRRTDEALR